MSGRDLARRLARVPAAVAGLLVVTFALVHLAPGDPVLILAGEHGDAAYHAFIRARFGLDRPLPEQFLRHAARVLQGDLGTSWVHGRPVLAVVAERLPATLLLMLTALALSTTAGTLLGIRAARRAGRPEGFALQAAAVVGQALPVFWLGQLAVLGLAAGAGLFPVHGMTDPRRRLQGLAHALDVLHHLALPALVLAAGELALVSRLVRAGLLEAFQADYVRTARAKGLAEAAVLRHALGNALLPVVTVVGVRLGMLLAGAVMVEAVFAWPGLGRLLLASVQARDHPVLLGLFLVLAVSLVLATLLADLVGAWLDPRIRR